MQLFRDFNERQWRVFLLVASFLARHRPAELQPLLDVDVGEAAAALAATFETAARGVIYEHRPRSRPAERLVADLKPLLAEAGSGSGGTAFERDAAVVLRRVEATVADLAQTEPENRRAFLDLMTRFVKQTAAPADEGGGEEDSARGPRLIVP